jgi:hypothetical protein
MTGIDETNRDLLSLKAIREFKDRVLTVLFTLQLSECMKFDLKVEFSRKIDLSIVKLL